MRLLAILWLMILLSVPCMAQSVSLAWDLSLSEPLGAGGGYKIYTSRSSGVYGATPAGTVAPGVSTITLTNLPYGRSYFVATAFVGDGTESEYSNEVSQVIKPKPPKINTATQVANAIKGAVTKVAGLFIPDKNLRIVR